MPPAETLFNITVLLIPIWIGGIRFAVTRTRFQTEEAANIAGVAALGFIYADLYAMWIAIEQIIVTSGPLAPGLYVLFIALAGVGVGGILLVSAQVEKMSEEVVLVQTSVYSFSMILAVIYARLYPPINDVVWSKIETTVPQADFVDICFAAVFIGILLQVGALLSQTEWPTYMKQVINRWIKVPPQKRKRNRKKTTSIVDPEQNLRKDTCRLGETVEYRGVSISVTDVYTTSALGHSSESDEDTEFVVVEISITNDTGEPRRFPTMIKMGLTDGGGHTYHESVMAMAELDHPFDEATPLNDGETRRGELPYEVPEDTAPLYWVFEFSAFESGQKAFWEIRN